MGSQLICGLTSTRVYTVHYHMAAHNDNIRYPNTNPKCSLFVTLSLITVILTKTNQTSKTSPYCNL